MKNMRADFPILMQEIEGHPLRFCDNASTTQKPQEVLDAMRDFYTNNYANIYRGIYPLGELATQQYEDARTIVTRYIGAADSSEVIFTRGTTEGINFIATAWGRALLKPGDVVIITALEHHANFLPWQQLTKTNGIILKIIPILENGALDISAAQKLIDARTRLLAITHISNAIGTHVDIEILIQYARLVGALVLIDAAQSAPQLMVNVQKYDPDFVSFSGHKMCGPTGIGVLYIKRSLHHQLEPYQFGGGMVFEVGEKVSQWLPAPHKFEAGTPPIAQAIGLGAAINYLQKTITQEELQTHTTQLCARLIDGLSLIQGIRILGPIDQLKQESHIVSFTHQSMHAHDIAAYLGSKGICVRAGHHCAQPLAAALKYTASVRVSFYLYNTIEDVDAIIKYCEMLFAYPAIPL